MLQRYLVVCAVGILTVCSGGQLEKPSSLRLIDTRSCPEAPGGSKASALFGCAGSQYDPRGRLMDWSHAGYAGGERPIPEVPVIADVVKDHGAKGDNATDDTAAFRAGLKAVAGKGALYVPPGVYRITAPLYFNISSTVLWGAGSGKTILWIPRSLTDIFGNSFNIYNTSNSDYCWGSAFLDVGPPAGAPWPGDKTAASVPVREASPKGATSLAVTLPASGSAPTWLTEDAWVMLKLDPTKPGFASHLLGGLTPPGELVLKGKPIMLPAKIKEVDVAGRRVVLNRQLPFDVRPEWGAVIAEWKQPIREVGIEGLSIIFKDQRYNGHHAELGYNGIFFNRVANSWVKDVRVHNADNGVLFKSSFLNTATDVTVSSAPRAPLDRKHGNTAFQNGHIGVGGKGGADNHYTRFNITTTMCHDLVIDSELLSVFSSGRGINITPDHHRLCPYGTLWTDIDVGSGARLLDSSGPPPAGPHACAYTTFWNIRTSAPVTIDQTVGLRRVPIAEYGPLVNLVGVPLAVKPKGRQLAAQYSWHLELHTGGQVHPPNLHEAQLSLVKGRLHHRKHHNTRAMQAQRAM